MMQYKGYTARAELDADAGLLHGEVLGIRDVVTFQAKSVDKLLSAFRASVDDYLAFCKKRGEQPDEPLSGKFVVRLDPRLHRKVALAAAASGMSLNSFVAACIDSAVACSPSSRAKRKAPQRRGGRPQPRRQAKAA